MLQFVSIFYQKDRGSVKFVIICTLHYNLVTNPFGNPSFFFPVNHNVNVWKIFPDFFLTVKVTVSVKLLKQVFHHL